MLFIPVILVQMATNFHGRTALLDPGGSPAAVVLQEPIQIAYATPLRDNAGSGNEFFCELGYCSLPSLSCSRVKTYISHDGCGNYSTDRPSTQHVGVSSAFPPWPRHRHLRFQALLSSVCRSPTGNDRIRRIATGHGPELIEQIGGLVPPYRTGRRSLRRGRGDPDNAPDTLSSPELSLSQGPCP